MPAESILPSPLLVAPGRGVVFAGSDATGSAFQMARIMPEDQSLQPAQAWQSAVWTRQARPVKVVVDALTARTLVALAGAVSIAQQSETTR